MMPDRRLLLLAGAVALVPGWAARAAQIGAPAGQVYDAVRALYAAMATGRAASCPACRTGRGTASTWTAEPVNLIHGDATPLAAGMCFSNEPGLSIPGAFGVRIEDCFHITAGGLRCFSTPPASLDAPFG